MKPIFLATSLLAAFVTPPLIGRVEIQESAHASAKSADVPATAPTEGLTWITNLDQGYKDAAKRQRPMLLIYGAEWCGPCKALEKQMQRPEVIEKLSNWTLVHIDVDKQAPGAAAYAGAIPALRLLSAAGKPITSREGYLSGEDLIRWLSENEPKAAEADPDLASKEEPDEKTTVRLIQKLIGADPTVREAAIQRLAPWPKVAGKAVVEIFSRGNLRTRLASLDLLAEWNAPIDGIDPWRPETIDAARVDAMRQWAATVRAPATRPAAPDAQSLAVAQEDLAAFLRATDPAEASVLSARLARMGSSFLPQVAQRLKDATSDGDREKLTALRYRLVATEALALGWPGGIERLAAADPQTRHAAAEELSSRAVAGDGPLLLELFSDPDPLVREISLHGLQAVGGEDAMAALAKLLHDPVSNVRAAVLKQLAEKPNSAIADAVIAYIAGEKDADLVVHAVRVLKAEKGSSSVKCLIGLLDHESWRVRAEAIDSLADIQNAQVGFGRTAPSEIAAAVIKRLDDPDGFVAGRAMAAMKILERGASPKLLNEAVKHHPELAFDVIATLAGERNSIDGAAVKSLKGYTRSENPAIRAKAVVALAGNSPRNCEAEVRATLADKAAEVRIAAAHALFDVLADELPKNGMVSKHAAAPVSAVAKNIPAATQAAATQISASQPSATQTASTQIAATQPDVLEAITAAPSAFSAFDAAEPYERVDPVQWMTRFRAGEGRPPWYGACIPALQTMLKSGDVAERLAAAFPLAALGHEDEALPVALDAAKDDPHDPVWRDYSARLLPWLPWEKRLALLKKLVEGGADAAVMSQVAAQLAIIPDPRAADLLWGFLTGPNAETNIEPIYSALRTLYRLDAYYADESAGADAKKPLKTATQAQLAHGNDNQRLVALALMTGQIPEAADEAAKIFLAPATSDAMRLDAFQMMLLAPDHAKAQATAVAALKPDSKPAIRILALRYLARGGEAVNQLHGSIYMSYVDSEPYSEAKPIVMKAPDGLSANLLAPFLKSVDPEEAADAGYLMCLLGKREGLAPLLRFWNEQKAQRYTTTHRLVYRAIAVLDDDAQTPVLEEIFKSYESQNWELRKFYWTIRSMHGSHVLALRKTIRDKAGNEILH